MTRLGRGYGSEWHLLRYLARYRDHLDVAILRRTGGRSIRWFPVKSSPHKPDAEWRGIQFLPENVRARIAPAWKAWWPQSRNAHSWDAIGQLDDGAWLLVEAKAYPAEAHSACKAQAPRSLAKIAAALQDTKRFLGAREEADWMRKYYQTANRLAFLTFLTKESIRAHLVFLNFVGDARRPGDGRPRTPKEWQPALRAQRVHLGLAEKHPLSDRVHQVFLRVYSDMGYVR